MSRQAKALLPARQMQAALLLAQGYPIAAVAGKLQVTTETLRLWRQKDEFNDYLHRLMEEIEAITIDSLRGAKALAAQTMMSLLAEQYHPAIRLRAAKEILQMNGIPQKIQQAETASRGWDEDSRDFDRLVRNLNSSFDRLTGEELPLEVGYADDV